MNYPSKDHFSTAKRVVRYIARSIEYGLWFSRGDEGILEAYSDSDWGCYKSNWKSTIGLFIFPWFKSNLLGVKETRDSSIVHNGS